MTCPVSIPLDVFTNLATILVIALVAAIAALAGSIENDPGPGPKR